MAGFSVFPDSRVLKLTDDPISHYFHIFLFEVDQNPILLPGPGGFITR